MTIKAIETRYKGYRFRSRLEARWAVFFDALGLKWDYEPEGFELAAGRYLPDFRVEYPGRGPDEVHFQWFEVKGDVRAVGHSEWARMLEFGESHRLVLLDGTPECRMYIQPSEWVDADELVRGGVKLCGYKFEYDRCGCALWCAKGRLWWDMHSQFFGPGAGFDWDADLIRKACEAAKSARFEFGENIRETPSLEAPKREYLRGGYLGLLKRKGRSL